MQILCWHVVVMHGYTNHKRLKFDAATILFVLPIMGLSDEHHFHENW